MPLQSERGNNRFRLPNGAMSQQPSSKFRKVEESQFALQAWLLCYEALY